MGKRKRTPAWMKQKKKVGRAWKLDRQKKFRSKTTFDPNKPSKPHTRGKCWVRGHTRMQNRKSVHVRGHYRTLV